VTLHLALFCVQNGLARRPGQEEEEDEEQEEEGTGGGPEAESL
jgi:hypothetical protein